MIELWGRPRLPVRFRCAETSAILQIEAPAVPNEIAFAGRTWRAKREFHITLLGGEAMVRIASATDKPVTTIRRIARQSRMAVEPKDSFWILEEPPVASIIVECDVIGDRGFYDRVETSLGVRLDPPPFHITLFTSGSLKGIGIHSRVELGELGSRLDGEQDARLAAAIGSGCPGA